MSDEIGVEIVVELKRINENLQKIAEAGVVHHWLDPQKVVLFPSVEENEDDETS